MHFNNLLSLSIFYRLVASAAVSVSPSCPLAGGLRYLTQSGKTFVIECDKTHPGGELAVFSTKPQADFASCINLCAATADCLLAGWEPSIKTCKLKGSAKKNSKEWKARLGNSAVTTANTIASSASADDGVVPSAPTDLPVMARLFSHTYSKAGLPVDRGTPLVHQSVEKRSDNPGKRGLPYNLAKYMSHFAQPGQSSRVHWAYNWYSTRYTPWLDGSDTSSFNPALHYIPMLLSLAPDLTAVWDGNVAPTAGNGNPKTDAILSFNEPDNCLANTGGTCMTVSTAVSGYKKYITKYGGKVKLGSPSVTNGPAGLPWLTKFLSACSGCQVDFVVAHFYADASDGVFDYFKSYLENFHAKTNKPIWVTEFALNAGATDKQQQDFLKSAINFMDSATYIHRYAYFWDAPGSLVNADGSLTALGKIFDHYPTN